MRSARNYLNYREIARRMLLGQDTETIATELDLTIQWVRKVTTHPGFMKQLATLETNAFSDFDTNVRRDKYDLHSRIEQAADEAFDELLDIMRTAPEVRERRGAANDILSMGPYAAIQKHAVVGRFIIEPAEAALISETLKELPLVGSASTASGLGIERRPALSKPAASPQHAESE